MADILGGRYLFILDGKYLSLSAIAKWKKGHVGNSPMRFYSMRLKSPTPITNILQHIKKRAPEGTSSTLMRDITVSPRWGDTAGDMTAVNFTKNKYTLTRGSAFFVSTPFCETKSTDLKKKPRTTEICLFLEPIILGDGKSTET